MSTTADRPLPGAVEPNPPPATPTMTAGPTTTAPQPPAPAPSSGAALGRLIRRVHFYAGLLVAPFLAILCLTGIAYVFTPQINDALYSEQLIVEPGPGPVRPLDEQVAAARAAYPEAPLDSVEPAVQPDRTTAVVLAPSEVGDDRLAVYVNPYTSEVTGVLQLTHGEPPVQSWLRGLHGDLHLGTVGAIYSEFAASWLPVLFVGGILMWLGKYRDRRRALLIPPRAARPGRARMMNWHGSVGIWLTAALVFISLTGLTWSTFAGDRFDTVLTALDARTPKMVTTSVPVPAPDASTITVGHAEASGRAAGLQGPLTLTPPAEPGEPFLVAETSDSIPLHRDKIALDPFSGEVVETLRFGDYPLLAQLTTYGIRAHTGTLFGLFNQIALTAMALGILALIFWGYRMWWQRRPTPRPHAPSAGAPRSAPSHPATAAVRNRRPRRRSGLAATRLRHQPVAVPAGRRHRWSHRSAQGRYQQLTHPMRGYRCQGSAIRASETYRRGRSDVRNHGPGGAERPLAVGHGATHRGERSATLNLRPPLGRVVQQGSDVRRASAPLVDADEPRSTSLATTLLRFAPPAIARG